MKIVVIETDHQLAKNVGQALSRAGHSFRWFVDPQAAIAASDSECPELIIMDLILAGRSGVEFLYEFRSYPEWADVPVIVFSSLPATEAKIYIDGFSKLQIKGFLYKPTTSLAQLVQSVELLAAPAPA